MGGKLTFGTVVYDDFDGLYFTIQAIRMYHADIVDRIEFVVVDNNPLSPHGVAAKEYCRWIKQPCQYIPFDEYKSTSVRNLVFQYANTEYVLCADCHVLFEPESIKKLLAFFDENGDACNLIQGPLVYDDFRHISTHFDPVWRAGMWGVWATDERGKDKNSDPFEIPMQGLGAFACRKSAWLGFNPLFRGFGGEEGYIHEKFRRAGRKTLCAPFFRWSHRFARPSGISYPLRIEDRIINYFIGHLELGLDTAEIYKHFDDAPLHALKRMEEFAKKELELWTKKPCNHS